MPPGMEVGLDPGDFVLDGDSAPPPKKKGAQPPSQFSAHVRCGQTAGCIMIPIGTEVGLSTGDTVLDGDSAPPKRGTAPVFGPCLLWLNGWMDQDATLYGSRPRPRPQCVRGGPSYPLRPKGAHQPTPSFRLMSIVATVAYLSCC